MQERIYGIVKIDETTHVSEMIAKPFELLSLKLRHWPCVPESPALFHWTSGLHLSGIVASTHRYNYRPSEPRLCLPSYRKNEESTKRTRYDSDLSFLSNVNGISD